MIEETITFLNDLWEKEAGKNEEQFMALLSDRWPVHKAAFTC
jgi:hypothetical protein